MNRTTFSFERFSLSKNRGRVRWGIGGEDVAYQLRAIARLPNQRLVFWAFYPGRRTRRLALAPYTIVRAFCFTSIQNWRQIAGLKSNFCPTTLDFMPTVDEEIEKWLSDPGYTNDWQDMDLILLDALPFSRLRD